MKWLNRLKLPKVSVSGLFVVVIGLLIIGVLGRMLFPGELAFTFHDDTQATRVSEFAFNLRSLNIPPRMAPHMVFGMGYPVFNFYAPFSYWVTSLIHLTGFDVVDSMKLSFLLAMGFGFTGMIAYIRNRFSVVAAVVGAVLYISSPWLAVEIFVRGNLGEVWFLALIPWLFFALDKNVRKPGSVGWYIFAAAVASFVFTVHNALSVAALAASFAYVSVVSRSKRNVTALFGGLLLSAYFLIPAVLELPYTYAKEIATHTRYFDHFLCPVQIWTTNAWGFGGSAVGCTADGMSFMLGKPLLVLAAIAVSLFVGEAILLKYRLLHVVKDAHKNHISSLILFMTGMAVISFFLTTEDSYAVWQLGSTVLSGFQFPWRFLTLALFPLAVLASYGIHRVKLLPVQIGIIGIVAYGVFRSVGYFAGQPITKTEYMNRYLSSHYIQTEAARKIPEYVVHTVDYRSFELVNPVREQFLVASGSAEVQIAQDTEFYKSAEFTGSEARINIVYYPYWQIAIDGKTHIPDEFDFYGRPIIRTGDGRHVVNVAYRQSPLQKSANYLTILTILILVSLAARNKESTFYRFLI